MTELRIEVPSRRVTARGAAAGDRRGRAQGPHAVELERHVPRRGVRRGRRAASASTSRSGASARCGTSPRALPPRGRRLRARPSCSAGTSCRSRCRGTGAAGRGLAPALRRGFDFEQHYFTLYEDEANCTTQLRRFAVFDLAGQQHRPQERALPARRRRAHLGHRQRPVFHHEPKLRTVIWEFGGEPMPSRPARADAGLVARAVCPGGGRPPRRSSAMHVARPGPRRVRRAPLPRRPAPAAATPGRWSDERGTLPTRSSTGSSPATTSTSSSARSTAGPTPDDWDGLVRLRDRCRAAVERGFQLWPAASLAEYRLALRAPAAVGGRRGRRGCGPLRPRSAHGGGGLDASVGGAGAAPARRAARGDGRPRAGRARRGPVRRRRALRRRARPAAATRAVGAGVARRRVRDAKLVADPSPLPALEPVELPDAVEPVADAEAETVLRGPRPAVDDAVERTVEVVAVDGSALQAIATLGPPAARVAEVPAADALARRGMGGGVGRRPRTPARSRRRSASSAWRLGDTPRRRHRADRRAAVVPLGRHASRRRLELSTSRSTTPTRASPGPSPPTTTAPLEQRLRDRLRFTHDRAETRSV